MAAAAEVVGAIGASRARVWLDGLTLAAATVVLSLTRGGLDGEVTVSGPGGIAAAVVAVVASVLVVMVWR